MMQYELYDIENKNLPIGIFETYEAAGEAIGLSADAVYYAIKRDSVMKGRYKAAKITLLDNNFTADPHMIEKCEEIKERELIVDISQGIDVRLLTDKKAKALSEIKHLRSVHYAWDLMKHEKQVMQGIETLTNHIKKYKQMCFMLVGFNTTFDQDMYRFKNLVDLKVDPYVMIYNKKGTVRLKHFARWVNGRIYKKCDWQEYKPWIKAKKQKVLNF